MGDLDSSGTLETEGSPPDCDHVAVIEFPALHRRPVHLRAVGRPEVEKDHAVSLTADLGVMAGDVRVGERDRAIRHAADRYRLGGDPEPAAVGEFDEAGD